MSGEITRAQTRFTKAVVQTGSPEELSKFILGMGLDHEDLAEALSRMANAAMTMLKKEVKILPENVEDQVKEKILFAGMVMFGTGYLISQGKPPAVAGGDEAMDKAPETSSKASNFFALYSEICDRIERNLGKKGPASKDDFFDAAGIDEPVRRVFKSMMASAEDLVGHAAAIGLKGAGLTEDEVKQAIKAWLASTTTTLVIALATGVAIGKELARKEP